MLRLLAVFLLLASAGSVHAQSLGVKKTLTLEIAKKMLAASEAEALKSKWTMAIWIVDDGAYPIALHKMDETQLGSIKFALAKARSAVQSKRSTKVFAEALQKGSMGILKNTFIIPTEGGIPIIVDGKVIGAIGTSGGSAEQDGIVAQAGLNAIADLLK